MHGGFPRYCRKLGVCCVLWVGSIEFTVLLSSLTLILSDMSAGIVILLWSADGDPPPNLRHGLTLNTILAFLVSLARVAFLVPIVEGLGQLKWIWFLSPKPRPLADFQLFDEASHGGIAGLRLLFSFRGYLLANLLNPMCGANYVIAKSFRASLGAFVMLSGLLTSTITQQAISYTVVEAVSRDNNSTATIDRATTFSAYDGNRLVSQFTRYPLTTPIVFTP